jgi:hypothetical protein
MSLKRRQRRAQALQLAYEEAEAARQDKVEEMEEGLDVGEFSGLDIVNRADHHIAPARSSSSEGEQLVWHAFSGRYLPRWQAVTIDKARCNNLEYPDSAPVDQMPAADPLRPMASKVGLAGIRKVEPMDPMGGTRNECGDGRDDGKLDIARAVVSRDAASIFGETPGEIAHREYLRREEQRKADEARRAREAEALKAEQARQRFDEETAAEQRELERLCAEAKALTAEFDAFAARREARRAFEAEMEKPETDPEMEEEEDCDNGTASEGSYGHPAEDPAGEGALRGAAGAGEDGALSRSDPARGRLYAGSDHRG